MGWHYASPWWDYKVEHTRQRVIITEDRDDTLVFFIEKQILHLRDKQTRRITTFTHYFCRGRWRWRDSRYKDPVTFRHIMAEVARMVASKDTAKDLLHQTIFGESPVPA